MFMAVMDVFAYLFVAFVVFCLGFLVFAVLVSFLPNKPK